MNEMSLKADKIEKFRRLLNQPEIVLPQPREICALVDYVIRPDGIFIRSYEVSPHNGSYYNEEINMVTEITDGIFAAVMDGLKKLHKDKVTKNYYEQVQKRHDLEIEIEIERDFFRNGLI